MMKKYVLALLAVGLVFPMIAQAESAVAGNPDQEKCRSMLHYPPAIGDSLSSARSNLLALIDEADAALQIQKQGQIKVASAQVDAYVDNASDVVRQLENKLNEFSSVWEAFKNTRESQIIPAIQSGNREGARQIAEGIQADRIKRMRELLAEMKF